MSEAPKKIKVAVLGGGVSSMTAAFELTSTKELRDKYEVTVYQLGWRIGGKGASGRNHAYGERIEEHGLHIWFGFYENAFQAMDRLYRELGRSPQQPLATWQDAFKPTDDVVLFDSYNGQWIPTQFKFPRNNSLPTDNTVLPTFWDMAYMAMSWAWEVLDDLLKTEKSLFPYNPRTEDNWDQPDWFDKIDDDVDVDWSPLDHSVEFGSFILAHKLAEARSKYPEKHTDEAHYGYFCAHTRQFSDWLHDESVQNNQGHDLLRVFFTFFDTLAALCCGVIEDNLMINGFDQINHLEFRQWLEQKGMHPISKNGPLLRSIYDVAFAYEKGDIEHPNMAAGSAARGLLRLGLTYKGAFMWKMQAGMGDTIFTPFYEVLKRRGVQFKFFHWITNLRLSKDKKLVNAIEYVQQVELNVSEYHPLVTVKGLDCWPNEPNWKQIKDAEKLKRFNLEETPNPLNHPTRQLKRGEDFDIVVLGISVEAIKSICSEMANDKKNPRFKAMLDNAFTVQTQAFQLWMNQGLSSGLHWKFNDNSVTGTYVEPLDTYADMSHLIPRENWPAKYNLSSIAYFCGVLKDNTKRTQATADNEVRRNAIKYLKENAHGIWPAAKTDDFDWDWLIDPQGGKGEKRFDSQYWRANFEATERYVITPAQAVQHRLKTNESGYQNLFLTGDWIKNGFDLGCVESAVMSGMQTSRAICGSPEYVIGESDNWLIGSPPNPVIAPTPAELAPQPGNYVNYGGRTTNAPMPGYCRDVRLNGFILEADYARLKALTDRAFAIPTRGRVQYIPITKYVMLSVGDLGSISSMVDPFHDMGYVHELQVSFWVLTARVRQLGNVYIAEDLAFFIPYMWVQNPVSLSGGREVVGYNKSWGKIYLPQESAPERFGLEAYGVKKFSPTTELAEQPLLDVIREGNGLHPNPRTWDSPQQILEELKQQVAGLEKGSFLIPGLQFAENLFTDAFKMQIPQIFLKQTRSMVDGIKSDYQAIIKSPARINALNGLIELPDYRVTIHHQDSYPLFDDLGIKSQKSLMSFEVKMDFTIENGQVLWETSEKASGCGCSPLGLLFGRK